MLRLTLLCALATTASADPRSNAREKAADARELRTDRREMRDDLADARRLQVLLDRFDAARAKPDPAALAVIDGEMVTLARRETREDAVEVGKDVRELRRDRREIRHDVREGKDARDDRHDRRDDRRDLAVEAANHAKRKVIAQRLIALAGKQDVPSLDAKRGALVELIAMARAEIRQDVVEKREDRRERREDRRERREDRKSM